MGGTFVDAKELQSVIFYKERNRYETIFICSLWGFMDSLCSA